MNSDIFRPTRLEIIFALSIEIGNFEGIFFSLDENESGFCISELHYCLSLKTLSLRKPTIFSKYLSQDWKKCWRSPRRLFYDLVANKRKKLRHFLEQKIFFLSCFAVTVFPLASFDLDTFIKKLHFLENSASTIAEKRQYRIWCWQLSACDDNLSVMLCLESAVPTYPGHPTVCQDKSGSKHSLVIDKEMFNWMSVSKFLA